MRIERITTLKYVSMDGVEFENEEDCITHEREWFNTNFTGTILDANMQPIDYMNIPDTAEYFYIPAASDMETLETLYSEYSNNGRFAPYDLGVYRFNDDLNDYESLPADVVSLTYIFNDLGLDIRDYIPEISDESPEESEDEPEG